MPGLGNEYNCFNIHMGSEIDLMTTISDFNGNPVDVGKRPENLNDFVNYDTENTVRRLWQWYMDLTPMNTLMTSFTVRGGGKKCKMSLDIVSIHLTLTRVPKVTLVLMPRD